MKEEEASTSFLGCFDEADMTVARILRQFPELIFKYEYEGGILPHWGSTALRSVLVNIPIVVNRLSQPPRLPSFPTTLPCTETRRPVSNSLSPALESLSSSSHTSLHPKKRSPKLKLKKRKQLSRILEDEAMEESKNITENGGASDLVGEDISDRKEAEREREGEALLEYRIETVMSNEFPPLPDRSLIPEQTLLVHYCIRPIQVSKEATCAEARRKRKLEMRRGKSLKRPHT